MGARPVTFLSDYGYADELVGVCHAVIARIAPQARVIDLTHGIPRHDVLAGARALERALPYTASGVHVAVVDPGVGTERRAVAVALADQDRLLVGPDNGLLGGAIRRLGGAARAVDLGASKLRLEPVSSTFHGRDLFCPVAAHLAAGLDLAEAGEELDPSSLTMPPAIKAEIRPEEVLAHVVHVDPFGNAELDAELGELSAHPVATAARVQVEVAGGSRGARRGLRFADVEPGALLLYEDSSRRLALAINRGDAAAELGLAAGAEVILRPAR